MTPHSSTIAWKIPWTKEPGRLQSMGLLRVGYEGVTSHSLFTFIHWRRKWQPTPVFLPGESQGQGSLVGCRLWGCKSRTRLKWLSSSSRAILGNKQFKKIETELSLRNWKNTNFEQINVSSINFERVWFFKLESKATEIPWWMPGAGGSWNNCSREMRVLRGNSCLPALTHFLPLPLHTACSSPPR